MTLVDTRLVIVAENEVVFFRPHEILEESKSETINLSRHELKTLGGYPAGHKVFGVIAHQQSKDRDELFTFSENVA